MKRITLLSIALFSLLALTAFAGNLILDVPFAFTAGTQSLQAGKYEVVYDNKLPEEILLRNEAGKKIDSLKVITTLAKREDPAGNNILVFDNVKGKRYLSEVWLPGEDGFLVHATKGVHTHEVVKK